MPFPGNTVTFTNDLSLLSRLLGHPVVSLERERAPMMDLERITKVVLAPDRAIPLPPNNVLRNLGKWRAALCSRAGPGRQRKC